MDIFFIVLIMIFFVFFVEFGIVIVVNDFL